ncbi:bacillithiol biosynthesis cysteine-adding enzyme BshC [Aquirufa antheringensis]|uniref:bacillithiol biosynthesis cysteine-adding enzyme BshC n=1 Tax=Aquirufa antheringensis TaxID=2516559 RepID=UPI00208F3858|nr:bacillithiol biosynthesis cysteine-adding enzyme BshC [Aquirufa antheringensis]USQ03297.1 bacillithiol biosynthesis cysteine-adding enzyme BshC [Aquirufa antheringensis]
MDYKTHTLTSLNAFSKLLLDYLAEKPVLKTFYNNGPRLENFKDQIASKSTFPAANRAILQTVLSEQYAAIGAEMPAVDLRDENTFTVTTGHQLNIYTGPLYVIYKLVSTINLARKLQKAFPTQRFVPVYWMATEDHDFEEINHFFAFGTKYEWNTSQKGAVGRFSLSDFPRIPLRNEIFDKAYSEGKNLSEAVKMYMHALFGAEGLVCLDADDARLKSIFAPIMEADLKQQVHEPIVRATTEKLEALGYKTQVSARPVNLFELTDNDRVRLETGDSVDSTKASPNVILRPLYQEVILPNLAYIGGPAEVAYWLQLKGIFDLHQVPFPILLPRNFAIVKTQKQAEKAEKLGLNLADLFKNELALRRDFVAGRTSHKLDTDQEAQNLMPILAELAARAKAIDPTLEASVHAEQARWTKGLERLAKKLKRAEERNQGDEVRQVLALKEALFPAGEWQERHTNFLEFASDYPDFIHDLLQTFDPLHFEFYEITL